MHTWSRHCLWQMNDGDVVVDDDAVVVFVQRRLVGGHDHTTSLAFVVEIQGAQVHFEGCETENFYCALFCWDLSFFALTF